MVLGGCITFIVCLVLWPGVVLGMLLFLAFMSIILMRGAHVSRKRYAQRMAQYEVRTNRRRGTKTSTPTSDGTVKQTVVTPTQPTHEDDELWRSWDKWTGS